jgi:hypothetical protein
MMIFSLVSRGDSGEGAGLVAFLAFNAVSFAVADVGMFANASRLLGHVQALLGHLRGAVDHERQWGSARGHAVQLSADWIVDVDLTVARAFLDWDSWGGFHLSQGASASVGGDAFAHGVLQVSFLAEASNHAVLGADWAWVRVVAGGWAGGAAGVEDLVLAALVGWQHHELSWLDSWALFFWHAATIAVAQVSLFAGTAGNADSRADWVGALAGAVAAFALAPFLILTADASWWHGHGFFGRNAATFSLDAFALFVLQVAGFAEAADDALASADWARARVGAGRGAGGAAGHEHFVFLALRHFWWVSEEHRLGSDVAFLSRHADALRIAHESSLAEASDHALAGAWLVRGVRVGTSGWAGSAAGVEFLVLWALSGWSTHHRDGNGNIVVGLSIALFRADALAVSVFQVSLFTETPADTLQGTDFVLLRVRAVRYTGGSAGAIFGIGTALLNGERRDGDSEPKGANAEKESESKARVHR